MLLLPLSDRLKSYLRRHSLTERFEKQKALFEKDPRHSSLNTELLEPKPLRIYSFRVTWEGGLEVNKLEMGREQLPTEV